MWVATAPPRYPVSKIAPKMDVRGKTYTAVQSSRRTPRTFAKLNGHPKCSNASTTGAGFMNLMIPSGIRKSTTNPLKTRPIQTFLLDEEAPATECPISATWLEVGIFILPQ